jgi:hypothetical protein
VFLIYVWSILTIQCYIYFRHAARLDDVIEKRSEVYMRQIDPHAELADAERERLEAIRKAVAAGTYYVTAEAVASKMIEAMLGSQNRPSGPATKGSLETDVKALPVDQRNGRSG